MLKCEMIVAHHSDCECAKCLASTDEVCDQIAVGRVHAGEVLVCGVCATMMANEGFRVKLLERIPC